MTDKEGSDNPALLFVMLQGFFVECKITKAWKRRLVKTDNSVFPQEKRVVSAHILSRLHFNEVWEF